ncbi:MAG: isopentenyl-diphosphate Delta-isomerase [Bacteroidales bacterium]|nr:isopentenyl-diphosphate Delta-isomerase [Bacteroidales bacterium]MBN2632428.1 isopentenyl-diphosphate Delta-isomerase [Bacteroidales bacterium]
MKEPRVILVDENNNPTGVTGKMDAHRNALLHRAVSVFVVNSRGEWILQRRALGKYHSNGLWTNTCCTHPEPGETNKDAATRRLKEEMGITTELRELFSFIYRETLDNDLTEYELDHVFYGVTDNIPLINREEAEEWKTISFSDLHADITENPSSYTCWFRKIYLRVNESTGKITPEI